MTGRAIFLTYGDGPFAARRDALARNALVHGFSEAHALGPDDLPRTFCVEHHHILSQARGNGYWLWKPFIIRQVLSRLRPEDVLLYCDAGRSFDYHFSRPPEALLRLGRERGFLSGVSIPHHGPIRRWTKADCLVLMNANDPAIAAKSPVQVTWSVWTRCDAAFQFLDRWLHFAQDPRCLTDSPNTLGIANAPDFRDHRHDQAIASILTHQLQAPFVDLADTAYARILALRPQSTLANLFLKRPQDADDVASGKSALFTLAAAQWRLSRTGEGALAYAARA